ncbi:hypothetical protein EOM09_08500 [bacterium]|nr:hypothetical protein [bacterium]
MNEIKRLQKNEAKRLQEIVNYDDLVDILESPLFKGDLIDYKIGHKYVTFSYYSNGRHTKPLNFKVTKLAFFNSSEVNFLDMLTYPALRKSIW